MYHRIRIATVSLVAIAICLLSSTGTLSYFTDTDAQTNSFTVGNASSALAVYDDVTTETKRLFDASRYTLVDGREMPFYPEATNDGNIPVYQRFRVVIPKALAKFVTLELPTMNDNCTVTTTSINTCKNNDYTVTYNPSVDVNSEPTYAEYYIVSNNPLGVGNTTANWPTTKILINGISEADKALFTCADNTNNNCTLGISIYSDVIQTTGFTDALSAFANLAETY